MMKSLRQAIQSLFRLKMLSLIFVPPVISFIVILVVFLVYWSTWLTGLVSFFNGLTVFSWLQSTVGLSDFSYWISLVFLLLAFIPMAFLGAVIITSIFVMPFVLKEVGRRDFPQLEMRKGGSVTGSVWNMLTATVIFIVLFVVTLPLWLVPGLQVAIPLLLVAWLNKKIFVYDVLQDYASKEERAEIQKKESLPMMSLGMLLVLLSYIPLAFFFIPVLSALAFTYHGLNALQSLRAGRSGEAPSV